MTAPDRPPVSADVPHWRIDDDRGRAVRAARRAGAEMISLDFGGAHRGIPLDGADELAALDRWRTDIAIQTLAVNHANDLGLFTPTSAINDRCLAMVLTAADIAIGHGFRYLHVPSFRASSILCPGDFAATATFLGRCARHVGPSITILTESTLGAADAIALRDATGEGNVRVVADTGNLTDVGVDPADFVAACSAAGALAPVIHVKAPTHRPGRPLADVIRTVAWAAPSILLENDYRAEPSGLARDVQTLRRTTTTTTTVHPSTQEMVTHDHHTRGH